MSASSLADLLASQLPNNLAVRARALLSTQAALERVLPAALAGHVRVMQLDNGIPQPGLRRGAVASRLRQLSDADSGHGQAQHRGVHGSSQRQS